MNRKLIVLIVASLLSAYATAANLNLKQEFGGLDIAATTDDPDSPDAIKITNKSTTVVACTLSYTGAGAGTVETPVTIQPGKSGTIRVTVDTSSPTPRSANLKCAEKMVSSKK